jgi:hypothetical protein
MDPNNQPVPQNPQEASPQPTTTPDPIQQPEVQPADSALPSQPVPTGVVAPAPLTPAAAPQPGKKKLGKILAIVGGIVAVIIIAVLALGVMALPRLQSKLQANDFMTNITAGNIDKAVEISGDPTNKEFLTTASPKVKGQFKPTDSKFENGKGYYLYELTGAESKYARVTTKKDNGKRVIDSFVFGNDKLALVPGGSTTTQNTSTTPTATASNCLTQNDFLTIYKSRTSGDIQSVPYDYSKSGNPWVDGVKFLPDSFDYNELYPGRSDELFTNFANFYKQNSSKQFTFHLQGGVATVNVAADKDFANKRAQKVKDALVAKGVPAARIVIDDPVDNSAVGGSGVGSDTANVTRSVIMKIDATCDGSASSTAR